MMRWRKEIVGPLVSAVFAIVQAVLLSIFAFYLKDRVDADLKERAQTVSSIKEMQKVLDKLKESHEAVDRSENMVRLAMFGEDAIPVLINLAVANTKYDPQSILGPLDLLLSMHAKSVCAQLQSVQDLQNVSHPFDPGRFESIKRFQSEKCKANAK